MHLWGCRNEIEFESNCTLEFFNQENLRTFRVWLCGMRLVFLMVCSSILDII
jgi:hypothetical protein